MLCRRFLVLIVLTGQVALAPLAHASPPDPSWIGGLYDASDYDDIVLTATSVEAVPECHASGGVRPVPPLLGIVPLADPTNVPAAALRSSQIRAPPVP